MRGLGLTSLILKRSSKPRAGTESPCKGSASGQPPLGLGRKIAPTDTVPTSLIVAKPTASLISRDVAVPHAPSSVPRSRRLPALRPRQPSSPALAQAPEPARPYTSGSFGPRGAIIRAVALLMVLAFLIPLPETLTSTEQAEGSVVLRLATPPPLASYRKRACPSTARPTTGKAGHKAPHKRQTRRLTSRGQISTKSTPPTQGRTKGRRRRREELTGPVRSQRPGAPLLSQPFFSTSSNRAAPSIRTTGRPKRRAAFTPPRAMALNLPRQPSTTVAALVTERRAFSPDTPDTTGSLVAVPRTPCFGRVGLKPAVAGLGPICAIQGVLS